MTDQNTTAEVTTLKEWIAAEFDRDERNDIATYGCSAGWSGLTYYSDTNALYDRFEDEIEDQLTDYAEELGYSGIAELIANSSDKAAANNARTYKNWCVWVAVECICQTAEWDDDAEATDN